MKKFLMIAAIALSLCVSMSAQNQGSASRGNGWFEKLRAEKIAFLTSEMDLTPAEAQEFWPVYNQAQKKKDEALKQSRESFEKLSAAIREGKSDKEISSLLQTYLEATKTPGEIDSEYASKYLKILPASKVTKLYLGEERFRMMQFQHMQRRTHDQHNESNK